LTGHGIDLEHSFVQGVPSTTIIAGDDQTTQIQSLVQALSSIRLSTVIPPLQQNLITQAVLEFPLDIVQTGIANANFDLRNPFTASCVPCAYIRARARSLQDQLAARHRKRHLPRPQPRSDQRA
jgi:hypothetical protein